MDSKIKRLAVGSLCAAILSIGGGCAKPLRTVYICAIETPPLGMIEEQLDEAIRAEDPNDGPNLPYTYEWLKRLDRDCGIFDEVNHEDSH